MAEEKIENSSKEVKDTGKKTESAVEKVTKSEDKVVTEEKVFLSREYVVPLRKEFMKVASYKKAKRAVKALKQFLAKHMKVENRDIKLIKLDKYVNEEIWHRGIKNPPAKIKVKATKKDGSVFVELADIPDVLKYKKQKEERRFSRVLPKEEPKKTEESKPAKEQSKEEEEKEKANAEAAIKQNKKQAKARKHTTSSEHQKKVQPRRQVLQK